MASFIENIINENFEEIKNQEITDNDIKEFADYYQEVQKLREKYMISSLGRKQIAQEISDKLEPLSTFLYFLKNRSDAIGTEYKYVSNYISDYEMAMRLLLRLANTNGEQFALKKFIATDFSSSEINHGVREHEHVGGNIWVIGKKRVLDKINDKKYYFGSEFGHVADDIIKKGHSLIIFTDHYFNSNVKPKNHEKTNLVEFLVSGEVDNISCYLYNDELAQSAYKFVDFIKENGSDIKGIDEDTLFELIQKGNSESVEDGRKKLVLEKRRESKKQ